jgi:HK97 family phage prohead protease
MTMTRRAYSFFEVKAVNEERRIIRGIATTPTVDRVGDIVEPLGVKFKNPLAFLWQHNHHQPIGTVKFDKPTAEGITFEAEIPVIDEPGNLKDRVDEAWQSIKIGLVRAVSIGFRAIEYSFIENGGIRFSETEVFELSAVTIPAQSDAVITALGKNMDAAAIAVIKSFDINASAAPGQRGKDGDVSPGVSGKPKPIVKSLKPKERTMAQKTIAEQISAFEAARGAKAAELETIMTGSEGETLDAESAEAADTLTGEIKSIDDHLKRLRLVESLKASTAKPVAGVVDTKSGSDARVPAQVKVNEKPEPGIQFARFARCMILGKKTQSNPLEIAKQIYGERDPHIIEMVQKANISAVNTTTDAALFGNEGGVADYVEYLRNQTILGKFGVNGIPALRRVPFYYPVVTQASGGTAYWVAEGSAKPMTKPTWSRTELTPLVIAGLAAATLQALKFSTPDADRALRDDLTAAVVEAIDTAFIDPANAGTSGAKPAAITNGIVGTAASVGNDAVAIRQDAKKAMGVFVAAKNPLTSGVWIMSGTNALGASTLVNPLGQDEFPDLNVNGGMFMGLPVIVSEGASTTVTLVNASDIWLADEGGVNVDMSTEASLQMVDNPTGTSTGSDPVEATLVSMFQTNSVAIRVEKFINWARRRPTGVATITAATWGDESGS